jgi:serine phosphatase RsbU (regulator of sigma subunit)
VPRLPLPTIFSFKVEPLTTAAAKSAIHDGVDQGFGHEHTQSEDTQSSLSERFKASLWRKVKFPFGLKLGVAISVLSVGVAISSVYWLYLRTHSSLLESMATELQAIGINSAAQFTEADILALQALDRQMQIASLPLTSKMLEGQDQVIQALPSPATKQKLINLPIYHQLSQKLGEITNRSRRDNSSDIFIMDSYLLTQAPDSPDRTFLRILVDDEVYRYTVSTRKQGEAGIYYAPSSSALRSAFAGAPQADGQFHDDPLYGKVITAAVPLKDKAGTVVAVLGLNVDVTSIARQIATIHATYTHVTLFSLVLSLLVAAIVAHWLDRPIQKLYQGAENVRNHNFDTVIDVKSNDELQLLAETFNSMMAEIQGYTHHLEDLVAERTAELSATKQELETDLEKGQKLQRDFLPASLPQLTDWKLAALFEPAKKVAGDFYDVFLLPGDLVGLVIADVCDKGVGAAMFMGLFRSFIRVFSGQISLQQGLIAEDSEESAWQIDDQLTPEQALRAVEITNNYVSREHGRTGMFATLFFGVLHPQTGLLTYINGGHEPLYILDQTGVKNSLKPTGPAVGMLPGARYKIGRVQLEPGDTLVGYTDGVTDARSPQGEFFSNKQLLALLNQPATPVADLLIQIQTKIFTHIDTAPQFDDITMLGVQRSSALQAA